MCFVTFWISLELQTENLLIALKRAHNRSSAWLACFGAKDLLEVVLQETLVRLFSGKQFERLTENLLFTLKCAHAEAVSKGKVMFR